MDDDACTACGSVTCSPRKVLTCFSLHECKGLGAAPFGLHTYTTFPHTVLNCNGLEVHQEFQYYACEFNTVEINATFYRFFEASTFDNWRAAAPRPDFTYIIKANKWFTHAKKLHCDEKFRGLWDEHWVRVGFGIEVWYENWFPMCTYTSKPQLG